MIKRIQEIKNIGTFANARPASIELNQLVFIYGPNSQGKTTLCDIFKSLMTNNVDYIKERKTVGQTGAQSITFNCGNKKEVKFDNDVWKVDKKTLDINQIQVFDTEFVHNNVFTNSQIEHRNKENFTKFVIGDESVKLSQELHLLNENKKQLENEINAIETLITKKIENNISLKDFLAIHFKEDVAEEDCKCLALQSSITDETANKNNIENIKKLPLPKTANQIKTDFIEHLETLNNILFNSISFEKDDLLEKFYKHKETCIKNDMQNDVDSWLMQGSSAMKDMKCPFCGSDVSGNEIIESYLKLFSEEVLAYNKGIDTLKKELHMPSIIIPIEILKNEPVMAELNKKIYNTEITKITKDINNYKTILVEDIEKSAKLIESLISDFKIKKEAKLNNVYNSVDKVYLCDLKNLLEELNKHISNYNDKIIEYSQKAKEYIDNLSKDTIEKHIQDMLKELKEYKNIVLRNQLNENILNLQIKKKSLADNIANAKQKKNDFDKSQEKYLNEFFEDINNYFEAFGSRNYKINKSVTTRGTNKTYSLELKYKESKISPEKIQFVLSESDRRALALSIFFTKLKNTANKEMIIVLDDPITSFDLERMNVFINKLKELKDNVCQIFITTHYQSFFKKLVSLTRNDNPTLVKIKQEPISNQLIAVDEETESLLMDEYESALFEMTTFMNGTSHSYSGVSARTILQKYLEYHFAYELIGVKYNNLSELNQYLNSECLISDELFRKLENKRTEYNDPAHEFDMDTEEQKRNSVIELYKILQEV